MQPSDLSPFAHAMGLEAAFVLPEGPVDAPKGRAWWSIDQERRQAALTAGPRDLWNEDPSGAPPARAVLLDILAEVQQSWPDRPVVMAGFSQGGMLVCDTWLRAQPPVAGLALLSASRIMFDAWQPLASTLAGLPVFLSHGRSDDDLAFAAGERLRDFVAAGGGVVTWVPHDHGHQVPLVAWRAFRTFLRRWL